MFQYFDVQCYNNAFLFYHTIEGIKDWDKPARKLVYILGFVFRSKFHSFIYTFFQQILNKSTNANKHDSSRC